MTTFPVRILVGAAAGCGLLFSALPVRADVKIVSSVTVTHDPPTNAPSSQNGVAPAPLPVTPAVQTVIAFYKDDNARIEISGGLISLYNDKSGQVSVLDPAQKTYYVRSFQESQEPVGTEVARRTRVQAKLDVDRGSDAKTLAGLPAEVYILSGTATISSQRSNGRGGPGGGGGGRHHGRGGGGFPFPGGGFPLFQNGGNGSGDGYGGNPSSGYGGGSPSRTVEISGEVWLSDALRLPGDKKATLLPFVQQALTEGQIVIKSLTDNLNKKKDIPLDSRITLTRTDSSSGQQKSVTTTTHVSAVSQTPLSDALFQIPVGYTQIAPPAVAAPEDDNGFGGYSSQGRRGHDNTSGDVSPGYPQ